MSLFQCAINNNRPTLKHLSVGGTGKVFILKGEIRSTGCSGRETSSPWNVGTEKVFWLESYLKWLWTMLKHKIKCGQCDFPPVHASVCHKVIQTQKHSFLEVWALRECFCKAPNWNIQVQRCAMIAETLIFEVWAPGKCFCQNPSKNIHVSMCYKVIQTQKHWFLKVWALRECFYEDPT